MTDLFLTNLRETIDAFLHGPRDVRDCDQWQRGLFIALDQGINGADAVRPFRGTETDRRS